MHLLVDVPRAFEPDAATAPGRAATKRDVPPEVHVAPERAGDMVDFEEFFRHCYAPLVRALAVAFDPEGAADAVQDAFVQASVHWRRVQSYENPRAWVRRVAINRLIDQRRRQGRRDNLVLRLSPDRTSELEPVDIDLARAVANLPERQRLAVCLYYLADLPVAEVADLLAVSVGTVKSNLHDARAVLRERLGGAANGR